MILPPGKQAGVPRWSVGFFLRPCHDGSMRRFKSHVIPPLEGEEEDMRSVDEWAAWSALQIINGTFKAQSKGGRPVRVTNEEVEKYG